MPARDRSSRTTELFSRSILSRDRRTTAESSSGTLNPCRTPFRPFRLLIRIRNSPTPIFLGPPWTGVAPPTLATLDGQALFALRVRRVNPHKTEQLEVRSSDPDEPIELKLLLREVSLIEAPQ